MDQSTDGVYMHAIFFEDFLHIYKHQEDVYRQLVQILATADIAKTEMMLPIVVYNQMCSYIEKQLGPDQTILLGWNLSQTVFTVINASNQLSANATPLQTMELMCTASRLLLDDPKHRGLDIVSHAPGRIVIRRTQTFHSLVQVGIISCFIEKTGVPLPRVSYLHRLADGAPFDEYLVTWLV